MPNGTQVGQVKTVVTVDQDAPTFVFWDNSKCKRGPGGSLWSFGRANELCSGVMRREGNSWVSVGPRFYRSSGGWEGIVHDILFDTPTSMYIAGEFNGFRGHDGVYIPASNIVRLDFATGVVDFMEGGLNNTVRAVDVLSDGRLVCAGSFSGPTVPDVARARVVIWNPTTRLWESVGGGVSGSHVQCIKVMTGDVICAGGDFHSPGGDGTISNLASASWDEAEGGSWVWSKLPGQIDNPNNSIMSMTSNSARTKLYITGRFTNDLVGGTSNGHLVIVDTALPAPFHPLDISNTSPLGWGFSVALNEGQGYYCLITESQPMHISGRTYLRAIKVDDTTHTVQQIPLSVLPQNYLPENWYFRDPSDPYPVLMSSYKSLSSSVLTGSFSFRNKHALRHYLEYGMTSFAWDGTAWVPFDSMI